MAKTETCKECNRVTLRISWSQLRTHEECKQKSYLQRSGKRGKLSDQRVFFPGTVTDRVVRDWLDNEPEQNLGMMPEMVTSIIDRERQLISDEGGVMKFRDRADREKIEADCREAVTKIEPALLKYVVPFERQADFRFQVPLSLPHPRGGTEEVLLIGAMDILVKDSKGRFWVWDVKHTRDNGYWKKTQGQLGFYGLAVELMEGVPPIRVGLLQPLCTKQVLPIPQTADTRAQLFQRISGMARDIWNDEKAPRTDSKFCGFCDVRHACSKFDPIIKNGKKKVSLL